MTPKPSTPAPCFDCIPAEITTRPQWVLWQYIWDAKNAKWAKRPMTSAGYMASHANSGTWTNYATAKRTYEAGGYDGVGYVFAEDDPYTGIDLDKCLDAAGILSPFAADVVNRLDTYTEISPSGTGLKMLVRAKKPGEKGNRDDKRGIEIYDRLRFFTITGRLFAGQEITDRQNELAALHAELFPAKPAPVRPVVTAPVSLDDNDLLRVAFRNPRNGAAIESLYRGEWRGKYESQSDADCALCNHLLYYTQGDTDRADRLFRGSGLMRDKWEREDYRVGTMQKALDGLTSFYTPPGERVTLRAASLNGHTGGAASPPPASGIPLEPSALSPTEKAALVREGKRARRIAQAEQTRVREGLPFIECNNRHFQDKTNDALAALLAANNPPALFVRAGRPVRVAYTERGEPEIEPLGVETLRNRIALCANFVSTSEDRGTVAITPPRDVLENILAAPGFDSLPPLVGVTSAPMFAPDGTLQAEPGYCAASRMYYHDGGGGSIPDTTPTPANVQAAKELLADVLHDFRFADAASKAHTYALLIAPFIRPMIRGNVPMHFIEAPTQGTGKTLLANFLTSIFAPGGVPVETVPDAKQSDSEAEFRKKLTSSLMTGNAFILFDNITGLFESKTLAAVLTSPLYEDRLLGGNKKMRLPVQAVFVGTGNNCEMGGDMPRRIVTIRLDSGMENPEERTGFKIPHLLEFGKQNRARLVAAVLTLVRHWIAQGKPMYQGTPYGSFEQYTEIIGGILESIGIPGFLQNRAEVKERANPEIAQWSAFFAAWYARFEEKPVTIGEIVQFAADAELIPDVERGGRTRLGNQLRKNLDRVRNGLRLVLYAKQGGNGVPQYRLRKGDGLFSKSTEPTEPTEPFRVTRGESVITDDLYNGDIIQDVYRATSKGSVGSVGSVAEEGEVIPL